MFRLFVLSLFFYVAATPEIYTYLHTLSRPDALPIVLPSLSREGIKEWVSQVEARCLGCRSWCRHPYRTSPSSSASVSPGASSPGRRLPTVAVTALSIAKIGRASCRERVCQCV